MKKGQPSSFINKGVENLYLLNNGCIITWIIHQILKFSNKLKIAAGLKPYPLPSIYPSPLTGWMNWLIREFYVSNLNWLKNFPCHNIHVYSISIYKIQVQTLSFFRFYCYVNYREASLLKSECQICKKVFFKMPSLGKHLSFTN